MKYLPIVCVLMIISFFCGCQGKKNISPAVKTPVEINKTDFIEPADSSISVEQLNKMSLCNTLLDSLSIFYRDSFRTKDAVLLTRYQDDFTKAQDKICLRSGLPGGYKEYLWILKNIGNEKNKKILDSLKIKTY